MEPERLKSRRGAFGLFRSAHEKVARFREGRSRQPDAEFVAECGLADNSEAFEIAVAVRRAIAGVGLVDPLFIRASDRFPEELGILPLWDSMDWLSLIFELEKETGRRIPDTIYDWKGQRGFSVKAFVGAVYEQLRDRSMP